MASSHPNSEVICSVLIALVSRRETHRVLELLAALGMQEPAVAHEVIIADRLNNDASLRVAEQFPQVRRIACAPETSLPGLRTAALEEARGRLVIVTEDHCVPRANWLSEIVQTFARAPSDVAAIGGAVVNGLPTRWLDRATFVCEYGKYEPPCEEGPSKDVPGMNIAYVRQQLLAFDRRLLTSGFWETTVHPVLLQRGWRLLSSNAIQVEHRKHFGLMEFLHQRFLYSRYYAGRRFEFAAWGKRLAACALSPLLPPLLLWRFHRQAVRRPGYVRNFVAIAPLLTLFALVWCAGETMGYASGPGDALRKLE